MPPWELTQLAHALIALSLMASKVPRDEVRVSTDPSTIGAPVRGAEVALAAPCVVEGPAPDEACVVAGEALPPPLLQPAAQSAVTMQTATAR